MVRNGIVIFYIFVGVLLFKCFLKNPHICYILISVRCSMYLLLFKETDIVIKCEVTGKKKKGKLIYIYFFNSEHYTMPNL